MMRLCRHDPGFASAQVAIPVDVDSPHVFPSRGGALMGPNPTRTSSSLGGRFSAGGEIPAERISTYVADGAGLTAGESLSRVQGVVVGSNPLIDLPHCGRIRRRVEVRPQAAM